MQLWHLQAHAHLTSIQRTPLHCIPILSPAEQARAARTRPGLAREEFLAGRTLLRILLAHHLGCSPARVPLAAGADGKPCLTTPANLDFNVAHSHGLILIALALAGPLGIDLEYRNPAFTPGEALELARTSFSAAEFTRLAHSGSEHQSGLFYTAWTCKEALAKADGRGLLLPLDQIPAPAAPLDGDAQTTQQLGEKTYYLQPLHHLPGFAAAFASTRPAQRIRLYDAHPLVQTVTPATLPSGDSNANASGIVLPAFHR